MKAIVITSIVCTSALASVIVLAVAFGGQDDPIDAHAPPQSGPATGTNVDTSYVSVPPGVDARFVASTQGAWEQTEMSRATAAEQDAAIDAIILSATEEIPDPVVRQKTLEYIGEQIVSWR